MARWILHCHLGRRRVELPDPPTTAAVVEALERVAPRPGWGVGAMVVWDSPDKARCVSENGTLATLKRSTARSPQTKVSVYLPPDVRDQLLAAADAAGVTVSELGGRLIGQGLAKAGKSTKK